MSLVRGVVLNSTLKEGPEKMIKKYTRVLCEVKHYFIYGYDPQIAGATILKVYMVEILMNH